MGSWLLHKRRLELPPFRPPEHGAVLAAVKAKPLRGGPAGRPWPRLRAAP